MAGRFAAAYAADDIDAVIALLTEDAWYTMPPVPLEYQGRAAIGGFLRDCARWRGGRRQRLIPTRANGQPAFACYCQDSVSQNRASQNGASQDSGRAGLPRARADRADPGGRADLRHHPVPGQLGAAAVRAAAHAVVRVP